MDEVDQWVKAIITAPTGTAVLDLHRKLQGKCRQYPDFVRLVLFAAGDRIALAFSEVHGVDPCEARRYLV